MTDPYSGCPHYRRKGMLLAACCDQFVGCRFCHDKVFNEEEKDYKKAHTMDRHSVKTVRCERCHLVQEAGQTCKGCEIVLGAYWCPICVLLDDEDKGQFHCESCGICRVGGSANHTHCDKCGICVKTATFATHGCALNAALTDCTVCLESLHTSREAIQFLPCGHGLHQVCFQNFMGSGQQCCPLCKKMVVSQEYQRLLNEMMDQDIALAPMPIEYRKKRVRVRCNECRLESVTPFHVFGLKCKSEEGLCGGSYNTVKVDEEDDDDDAVIASNEEEPPQSPE